VELDEEEEEEVVEVEEVEEVEEEMTTVGVGVERVGRVVVNEFTLAR
jgi:hypothetical protein